MLRRYELCLPGIAALPPYFELDFYYGSKDTVQSRNVHDLPLAIRLKDGDDG